MVDETLLHIRFDAAGNVIAVDRTGKELIADISPVHRTTPSLGRKRDIFSEIFGGIGSVGTGGMGAPPAGNGGPGQ